MKHQRNHPGYPNPRMRPAKYLRACKDWHCRLRLKRAKNAAKMRRVAAASGLA